jgi:signal transduction histidine kinase
MPEGGTIGIHAETDGNQVRIFFEDSGPGLSEEIGEKIWDPFFTTKDKGTGLGLGIVKNIIDAHGGGIRMENRSEGGAQVVVDLPLEGEG